MRKRSLVLALAAALLVMCLAGCRQVKVRPKDESQARVKDEKETTIMCDRSGLALKLLRIAQARLYDYDIKLAIIGYSDMETRLTQSNIDPDLVILEDWAYCAERWKPSDYLMADLQPMIDKDDTFRSDDYFPGTVKAGKVGGRQLYLPIGIHNNHYIMAGEEQIKRSALGDLPQTPSLSEIYQVFIDDSNNYRPAEDEVHVSLMSAEDYMYSSGGYQLLTETGAIKIDWDEGNVEIDEEAALETMDFLRTMQEDWMSVNQTKGNVDFYFYHSMGNLPYEYDTNCLGWMEKKAPNYGLGLYSSMYAEKLGQSVRPFWLPRSEEAGTYTASVSLYGCIPEKAVNKEGAYEVLRYLMDMDADCWTAVESENQWLQMMFPARRSTGEALMQLLTERGPEKYTVYNGSQVEEYPGQLVSEEQAALVTQWMDGLCEAYIQDENLIWMAQQYLNPYYWGEEPDGRLCLEQFRAEAEKYVNERMGGR